MNIHYFIALFFLFIMISLMGWIGEVIFNYVTGGHEVNPGVLQGPWCPIYGFGFIGSVYFLSLFEKNLQAASGWKVFISIFIIATIVEYVAGWILEKIFKEKWWDYSKRPFNINGYICLSYSLMWGILGTAAYYIVFPFIGIFIKWFKWETSKIGFIFSLIIIFLFLIDLITSILDLIKVRKEINKVYDLNKMYDIDKELEKTSEDMSKTIIGSMKKIEEIYNESKTVRKFRRHIEKAYPHLYEKLLERDAIRAENQRTLTKKK